MKYRDNINWENPPGNLSHNAEEIHIYKCDLSYSFLAIQSFYMTLSSDERKLADQYKFEEDRLYFISARAILRQIIGRYLALKPKEILFSYTPYGKPYLAHNTLTFNVSHSGSLAMYIFAHCKNVGIDIEKIRPLHCFLDIAQQFFSMQENIDLHSIPSNRQLEAFFRCWTRKEAFIKAIGDGLSFPLNQFDVTLLPNETPRVSNINGKNNCADIWSMYSMNPMHNYECAFLFEDIKRNGKVFYFNWDYFRE